VLHNILNGEILLLTIRPSVVITISRMVLILELMDCAAYQKCLLQIDFSPNISRNAVLKIIEIGKPYPGNQDVQVRFGLNPNLRNNAEYPIGRGKNRISAGLDRRTVMQ